MNQTNKERAGGGGNVPQTHNTHSYWEKVFSRSTVLSSMLLRRASNAMERYSLQATVARASASSPCCHRKSAICWRCWSTAHTKRSLKLKTCGGAWQKPAPAESSPLLTFGIACSYMEDAREGNNGSLPL